jgi:hypothetical protein
LGWGENEIGKEKRGTMQKKEESEEVKGIES